MAGIGNAVVFGQGMRLQPSTSQDIIQMQKNVDDVSDINFTGDPNGNVAANPSSLCHDPVSGNVYFKQNGTGNTGWVLLSGTAPVTITADDSNSITSNPYDIFGQKSDTVPVTSTAIVAGKLYISNNAWETQYVVDASSTDGLKGTFTTIQDAIDQAFIDGMDINNPRKIIIRVGTYVEDLDIFSGAFFECGTMPGDPAGYVPLVTITGNHTLDTVCSFYSQGINWTSVTGDTFSGAATASIIQWRNSQFSNPDGYFLTSAGTSNLDMENCQFFGTSDGTPQFNLDVSRFTAVQCGMNGTSFNFTGQIPRFNECQSVGNIYIDDSPVFADNCDFVGFNAECVIQSSGASSRFTNCSFTCGDAQTSAVDYGTATPPFFINCYVLPINTPVSDFTNAFAVNVGNTPYYQTMGNVLRGIKVNSDYSAEQAIAYIGVSNTVVPRAIELPAEGFVGQLVYVMDETGGAAANNITVTGPSLINGTSSYVIDTNYGAVLFRCLDRFNWNTLMVSGASTPPIGIQAWVNVTGTSDSMAVNTGYLANNGSLVTLTLPGTAAQFSEIEIVGHGAGGWVIAQNASQQIIYGNAQTTAGVTGSLASSNVNDVVKLIATVGGSSTVWTVKSSIGNLTVV